MRDITTHRSIGDTANEVVHLVAHDEPTGPHTYRMTCGTKEHFLELSRGAGTEGFTKEALLAIVIDGLMSHQAGPMACAESQNALASLQNGLAWMKARTANRVARGVMGSPSQ
jgi:hypothetical protein